MNIVLAIALVIVSAASSAANTPPAVPPADSASLLITNKDWILLILGAVLGLAFSVISLVFPDLPFRIPFILYPRHTAKLKGKATLLHSLSAKIGDPSAEKAVDLSNTFRHPGTSDGTEWNVLDLVIRTRWNRDALLTCSLSWNQYSKPWTATVKGRGRYFGRNFEDFNGYVYVVCDCEGRSGDVEVHWKVVYEIKRKQDPTAGWDGFWLMFDADDATHAKLGQIDLEFTK